MAEPVADWIVGSHAAFELRRRGLTDDTIASVDVDRVPAEVVTAYRTSKLSKYWREER